MGVTRTGKYSWRITTDEKHIIVVDSILISNEWEKSAAYAGQRVYFIIDTAFVGQGSTVTVTLKTESGQTLESKDVKILNNHHRNFFQLSRTIEAEERIYFEVSSGPLKLHGVSGSIPVFAEPYVDSLTWSEHEAAGGDILTVSAQVYAVKDHTPAEVSFYEFCNLGAHEPIVSITKEVLNGKVEMMWQYRPFRNKFYLESRELHKEYGKEWDPPKFFFTVTIGSTEYGKENQDSGFLNILVDGLAMAHVLEFDTSVFYKGSAILLPDSAAGTTVEATSPEANAGLSLVRSLLLFADENRECELLITGHATSRESNDTKGLSKARADCLRALIEGDRDTWRYTVDTYHTVQDIQHLMTWAGYHPGPIDGINGDKTKVAVKAFQRASDLDDDGIMGPNTFGAVFDLYHEYLESLMSEASGQSALENRGNIKWAYPSNKAVGCGPVFPAQTVDSENLRSTKGGWMEALFFDPEYIHECSCQNNECDAGKCKVYKKGLVARKYLSSTKPKLVRKEVLVDVVEAEDVLFRYNSALMLPTPMPEAAKPSDGDDDQSSNGNPYATEEQLAVSGLAVIKGVLRYQQICVERNEQKKMLIAGHTDTAGSEDYNEELSRQRASVVLDILLGGTEQRKHFAETVYKKHTTKDEQHVLRWIATSFGWPDTNPGAIDGIIGPNTKKAIRALKKNLKNPNLFPPPYDCGEYSQDAKTLAQSLKEGDFLCLTFWEVLFELYQAEIKVALKLDELDIDEIRKSIQWVDAEKKFVGCGETWPLEARGDTNFESQTNRRVELLFYDPTLLKKGLPCKDDACAEGDCHIYKNIDRYDPNKEGPFGPKLEWRYIQIVPPGLPKDPAKTTPVLVSPDYPGSSVFIATKNVWVYVALFDSSSGNRQSLERFELSGGKLCQPGTTMPEPLDVGKEVYLYFSHRDDLDTTLADAFVLDISGFPLLGPITIPDGVDPVLEIDIWQQNDWCVVHNVPVDGRAATKVLMADWNEEYKNGPDDWTVNSPNYHMIFTDHIRKDEQEKWNGNDPIPLVEISTIDNSSVLVGTVSKLPGPKCKLLMQHGDGSDKVYATSFNEIEPTGENQLFKSHHTYDSHWVNLLAAIHPEPEASGPKCEDLVIDAFPEPPDRCFLPGDMCWQDQGNTMLCGTFSFAAAMNYWFPYTYNSREKDGNYCHDNHIVDTMFFGLGEVSTPHHIETACGNNNMNGVDRHCEYLTRARAIKLIKLWIQAGVPVVILVNEKPREDSDAKYCHYKTLVGYDGDRIFMNNSGMDCEIDKSERDSALADTDYEHSPIGNDVDSEDDFYQKWSEYSSVLDVFSSADRCTLIPMYPKDPIFADSKVR